MRTYNKMWQQNPLYNGQSGRGGAYETDLLCPSSAEGLRMSGDIRPLPRMPFWRGQLYLCIFKRHYLIVLADIPWRHTDHFVGWVFVDVLMEATSAWLTLWLRSRCEYGTIMVRSQYDHGTLTVRMWYDHRTIMVRWRYAYVTNTKRWGYGTITVRSWYADGTIKLRWRFVDGTITVRLW
jgi:hypothetical protein